MSKEIFNISASAARVAASCMADEDIRYYLNGIYIDPCEDGGAYVVGTNGHMLAVVHDKTAKADRPYIVRLDSSFAKKLPKRTTYDDKDAGRLILVQAGNDTRELRIANGDDLNVKGGDPIVEAKYPLWRKVLPDLSAAKFLSAPLHWPYLAKPSKAFKSDFTDMQVQIYQEDADRPAVLFLPFHPDCLIIVMPQRPLTGFADKRDAWAAHWNAQRKTDGVPERAEQHTEDPDHGETLDDLQVCDRG